MRSQVHLTICGPSVLDLVQHFVERWNEIKVRKVSADILSLAMSIDCSTVQARYVSRPSSPEARDANALHLGGTTGWLSLTMSMPPLMKQLPVRFQCLY